LVGASTLVPPYGRDVVRTRDQDACPGALTVHQAADGALVRVRLPGGMIAAYQLEALAHAAAGLGSGTLEMTARGNLQLRGLTATDAVAETVAKAGLLPSTTHERVRNIVASPLSGRVGGRGDVRDWVDKLDNAIQAEPELAALPGRFWFGIDDGRGDVSGLGADVGVHLLEDSVALLLAGRDTGVRLEPEITVRTMVSVAKSFARIREKAWRIAELADTNALLETLTVSTAPGGTWPPVTRAPVGWIHQVDGRVALGAAVPLGVLSARVAEYLAATGAPLVITPWRSVLVCDLDEGAADVALRVLAPMGLVFDENSPWLSVSACTGSPGCEHSAADVRADAARAAGTASDTHRHFVGCERACGSPPAGEVLVATGDGYRLRGEHP
jgi:precorrin-3B synthase